MEMNNNEIVQENKNNEIIQEKKDDEKSKEKKRKKKYIKVLSLLQMQISEFNIMKKETIKENKPFLQCYLINKDIIDNYKDLYLYNAVSNCLENLKKNYNINYEYIYKNDAILEKIFEKIGIDYKKLEILEKKINPMFFETETLKIKGNEYPYNFFILRKEIFDLLFENKKTDFKLYNTLIGKEGIFFWNSEKKNNYISIYFLNDFSSEVNKIYLFKEEEDFLNDFKKNIKGKEIKDYLLSRNLRNKEVGLFNLIDDGKIIAKYLNITKCQIYEDDDDYDYDEIEDNETKLDEVIENEKKKKIIIDDFLKYLLINLYYINELSDYSINFMNKENKEPSLLNAFSLFVNSYKKDQKMKIETEINNFLKVFSDKSLSDNVRFREKNQAYEKIIQKVIDSFNIESKPKKNVNNSSENNNNNKIIDDLFYGEKKSENYLYNEKDNNIKIKVSNILYIKDSNNDYLKSINQAFYNSNIAIKPKILILILENNNLVNIPIELEVSNQKYIFLSCIKKYENMDNYFSFVKLGDKYHKIYFNSNNNNYEDEECDEQELNNSFIFFYEIIKEENYTSGTNDIFQSSDIYSTNVETNKIIIDSEGYHDINSSGNLCHSTLYNNNININKNYM